MGGGEGRTNSGWTMDRPIGVRNGLGGGTCRYGTVARGQGWLGGQGRQGKRMGAGALRCGCTGRKELSGMQVTRFGHRAATRGVALTSPLLRLPTLAANLRMPELDGDVGKPPKTKQFSGSHSGSPACYLCNRLSSSLQT